MFNINVMLSIRESSATYSHVFLDAFFMPGTRYIVVKAFAF